MKTTTHTDHPFLYVRGCPSNPVGVMNRLTANGGVDNDSFKTVELANPHHIFYVDFHDGNVIKYMEDDTILWESLKNVWKELPPLNIVDKYPESWEEATDNFYEARQYDDDDNSTLRDDLYELGKLIVLRDIYRKSWVPSKDGSAFWYVGLHNNELDIRKGNAWNALLSFQTEDIANLFLNIFEKSIEKVKDYI